MLEDTKIREMLEESCRIVRNWMIDHYGTGVNLSGHCIEASILLCAILKLCGLLGVHMQEGWVRYDKEQYSQSMYDPHTWVQVDGSNGEPYVYLDVTGDQFDYGLDPENRISDIAIQYGLPECIVLEKPDEV